VRLLDASGAEVACQVTEVATWEPADPSLQWVWVSFLAGAADRYRIEYGDGVTRRHPPAALQIVNNQREPGLLEVTTGSLRFTVRHGEGGFLHSVQLDLEGDGFDDGDVIASGHGARGSFLDLLDEAGPDESRAEIAQTFIERGSGPVHAVLRVEGIHRYAREDNPPAPFVTRIHAWADRPWIRVLHTFVYTGEPDQHSPRPGEYAHVATQAESIVDDAAGDRGWAIPKDRIAAAGLSLDLELAGERVVRAGLYPGRWWSRADRFVVRAPVAAARPVSLLQTGPKPDRMPPVPTSSPSERLSGFVARLEGVGDVSREVERAEGWIDVSDERRGVAIGMRHFIEEYPKELRYDAPGDVGTALLWSDATGPASFARSSSERGREGAIENWAQGLAKTSELVYYFHGAEVGDEQIRRVMDYVLMPPVAHAEADWYSASGVWGRFAGRAAVFPELERSLDHKVAWVLLNQAWEPWYGVFDHGDVMVNFDGEDWSQWGHNEPAQDLILWLHFLRTGDPAVFDAAQALSRHTMDVDNTHWPDDPEYAGDTNYPLDYWKTLQLPAGGKYRGIGRRHSGQHWLHALSAHVWVAGWMADYYLAADHRALDVAIQTAEMHLRRLWGAHGVTGRRLYLSVWNLAEVWAATKEPRYAAELEDRVGRMLRLQREQGGSLVMDRYGYSHVYATHGLYRYLGLTDDPAARRALIRHARRARDVPSLNHWMESYLSALHALAVGWELTGEASFAEEIRRRVGLSATDALAPEPVGGWTQGGLFEAVEAADRLPPDPGRFRPDMEGRPRNPRAGWAATHGLRVYGWTHAYGLPWAMDVMRRTGGSRLPGEPARPLR
jgi:hypothetical protein